MSAERVPATAQRLVPDLGSFRDRSNRVYSDGARILRGIDGGALKNWRALAGAPFFKALQAEGKVVATSLAEGIEGGHASSPPGWAGFLVHERIPFITYPYEWSFSALKDAALLHLDILERAIPEGWTLKDASAYNVQFVGTRAVFIDLPSFEPYEKGSPWGGYRQFCMMFLYPLMFKAYRGIDYLPFLRGSLEGIDPQTANQVLSGASRFRKGVLGHVFIHSRMDAKYAGQDLDQAKTLTEDADKRPEKRSLGRYSEAMVLGTIQGLARTIRKLDVPESRTVWGNYDTEHSYAEASFAAKKAFVEAAVRAKPRRMAWDIGCNTGTFSQIAADAGAEYVVAIDGDTKAIERLYRKQKAAGATDILPIIMNLGNTSPAQGWRGQERKALEKRGNPEIILCLALIHHIVISANIPLDEFIAWLRDFDAEIVIEWVGPDDDMVRMLLRNRVDQYSELALENFERLVGASFDTVAAEPLKGGARKIFHLSPKRG